MSDELNKWLSKIDADGKIVDLDYVDIYIAGVNSIDSFQEGYLGDDWKKSWVVFARWSGADPIIFDSTTKEILIAMHGIGKWEGNTISSTFEKFDFILSTWQKVAKQYDTILDDGELKNDFIDELKEALDKSLDSKYIESFLGFITF